MKKDDFKLGENVELSTYNYDDQGNEYKRKIKGVVIQITNSFDLKGNIISNKEGIVFNNEQLEQVFSSMNKEDYKVKETDGIFYINKN